MLMKEVPFILDFCFSSVGYIFFIVYSKAELLDKEHKCVFQCGAHRCIQVSMIILNPMESSIANSNLARIPDSNLISG